MSAFSDRSTGRRSPAKRHRSFAFGAVAAVVAMTTAACSSSAKPAANPGSSGGATKSPITIGLVTTLTGPAASQFQGNLQGAQARFDLLNANGGVDGHRINLVSADDGTSFTGAASALTKLLDQNNAFAIIDLSDFTADAYKIPQKAGVPVVGFPSDGPEWGQQPNTNMISTDGNVPPTGVGGIVDTVAPKVAALLGAKNMAALALSGEPASVQGAESFVKAAAATGLKVGYKNYSIPIGGTNVGPIDLGMKQAGVDGFFSGLLNNTNFAIMTSAAQEGLHLVAPIMAAGYGSDLLDQPAAVQAAQGGIFETFQRPTEEPNAGINTELAAFAKYEHFTGIPSDGWTEGWISADLLIQGLEKDGASSSRAALLSALHDLKGYTADGLLPTPLDLSLAGFGKAPATECAYFTKLVGNKFVVINGGQPVCGKTIG